MRHHAQALFFFSILGLRPVTAQNPFEPETNMACVDRLPAPEYSSAARQARVEGTVLVAVRLSQEASVEEITTEFASKTPKVSGMLIQAVEKAIRDASF